MIGLSIGIFIAIIIIGVVTFRSFKEYDIQDAIFGTLIIVLLVIIIAFASVGVAAIIQEMSNVGC